MERIQLIKGQKVMLPPEDGAFIGTVVDIDQVSGHVQVEWNFTPAGASWIHYSLLSTLKGGTADDEL